MRTHYRGERGVPLLARVWAKVRTGDIDSCWGWAGSRGKLGHANFNVGKTCVPAYKLLYESIFGLVPDGLVLDHTCNNPRCCNPFHLRTTTNADNVIRGGSLPARNARKHCCKYGHPFEGENLYRWRNGRYCRTCRRNRNKAAMDKLVASGGTK